MHDLVIETTRTASSKLSDEEFSLQTPWSIDEFSKRLENYQMITSELLPITSLMGYWGTSEHDEIICLPAKRLSSGIQLASGLNVWNALRWYPILLLTYSIGLGAVASKNYEILYSYLRAKTIDPLSLQNEMALIEASYYSIGDIHNAFKKLPGRERQFVPISEYLYKYFQPILDDLLFLGNEYEPVFDRFEILIALEHGYERVKAGHMFWAPVGRFGWKSRHGDDSSPLYGLIAEGKRAGSSWAPLKAGFLDGSFENFEKIFSDLLNEVSRRSWL